MQMFNMGGSRSLQETRRLIENTFVPVINEYWEAPDFPFEQGESGRGRLGWKMKNAHQGHIAFLYLELVVSMLLLQHSSVHGGLCYNTILLGGDERQQKGIPSLNWLHLTGKGCSFD